MAALPQLCTGTLAYIESKNATRDDCKDANFISPTTDACEARVRSFRPPAIFSGVISRKESTCTSIFRDEVSAGKVFYDAAPYGKYVTALEGYWLAFGLPQPAKLYHFTKRRKEMAFVKIAWCEERLRFVPF